ncbi:MAG: phosphoglucosamine mutase [Paludibacteraceae bacterium]|nr:phosphoglucosamine mutase [Paludibacteraceae bacterium]
MTLVKSISGIRGTIGGPVGDGLSPVDIAKFTAAYATTIQKQRGKQNCTIVVGRDARISGEMVSHLVIGTLLGCGCNVTDIGLATTPTTEIAVTEEHADGGIILTASHNPKQWNALKLLNEKGEFLNKKEGEEVIAIADRDDFTFAEVDAIGQYTRKDFYTQRHIEKVLALKLVDAEAIRAAKLRVACDCVNSVGGIAIPALLEALGVEVLPLYCTPNGQFPHNPEPLPEHLGDIAELVRKEHADVGFVVDPDVDRLAIICENGDMFGEEYTLVSVADYILSHTKGNTVSNLSSSRALSDVTEAHGGEYNAAAVGEVNVVEMMKRTNAVIGGEGNGGVIYPEAHYGRDALVGIALFLTMMVKRQQKPTEIRAKLPNYFISKNKIQLTPQIDVDGVLAVVKGCYKQFKVNTVDGVKIDFPQGWVHLRKSNTEPIIRIYSEAPTREQADRFAEAIITEIKRIANIQ